jgi:hypothetical protein
MIRNDLKDQFTNHLLTMDQKHVEMIRIPIEVNEIQPYVPFHNEHITYAILIS